MKKGQVVKVEIQGDVKYGILINKGYGIADNGYVFNTKSFKVSNTRNVDPEIRKLLEQLLKLQISKKSVEEEIEKLEDKIAELKAEQTRTLEMIAKAKGLVSEDEFVDVLKATMDENILKCLDVSGYEIEVSNKWLIIRREAFIEKWYHGVMFYERYDHTTTLSTKTKEAKAEYDNYIKKYSKPVNLKGEYAVGLSLGDKDTLRIYEKYFYKLNKPLTKSFAEEIAKKNINRT